jgi:hypothetical protein
MGRAFVVGVRGGTLDCRHDHPHRAPRAARLAPGRGPHPHGRWSASVVPPSARAGASLSWLSSAAMPTTHPRRRGARLPSGPPCAGRGPCSRPRRRRGSRVSSCRSEPAPPAHYGSPPAASSANLPRFPAATTRSGTGCGNAPAHGAQANRGVGVSKRGPNLDPKWDPAADAPTKALSALCRENLIGETGLEPATGPAPSRSDPVVRGRIQRRRAPLSCPQLLSVALNLDPVLDPVHAG